MTARLIEAQGSAYERGRAIGAATRDRIHTILAKQEDADRGKDGLTLHEWLPTARSFLPLIETHAPETLMEMRGVADGAALPFEDILLLACVYEKRMGAGTASHCTGFAALDDATSTGNLICGQNNDEEIEAWSGGEADVVVHHVDESGLESLIYTHAGIPAYMGMNSAGLCILWMYIDNGERGPGVPTCIILRELLRHESLDAAVNYLGSIPRAVPNNFILAHATDGAVNIEYSSSQFHPTVAATAVCHANHIVDSAMSEGERVVNTSTSRDRQTALTNAVATHTGKIDVGIAKQMLSDHSGAPRSICAHPHAGSPNGKTLASMVFHPAEAAMYIAFGNGCETPYDRYAFTEAATARPTATPQTAPATA